MVHSNYRRFPILLMNIWAGRRLRVPTDFSYGWTRGTGFSERGSQIPYESTSGPQWPHNGLTMATQWPLVFLQVAPVLSYFKKIKTKLINLLN